MLCRCCGEERDPSRFAPGNRVCRPCRNAKKQATRDPEKHRLYARTSYQRHRGKICALLRSKREASPDEVRAKDRIRRARRRAIIVADPELLSAARVRKASESRKYYARNREAVLAKMSERKSAKRALARVSGLQPLGLAPVSAAPVFPRIRLSRQKRLTEAERALRRRLKNQRKWAKRKGALGRIKPADIAFLMEAQRGCCFYCSVTFGEAGYQIDHFVPLARGGSNYRENLRLACAPCNIAKSDMPAEEFMRVRGERRVLEFLNLAGDLPGVLRQKAVNVMRDNASIMANLIALP